MTSPLHQTARLLDSDAAGDHGDHWRAVLGAGADRLGELLGAAIARCEIAPPLAATARDLALAGEPMAFGLVETDHTPGSGGGGLFCVVEVSLDAGGQPTVRDVRTAYPYLGTGAPLAARVRAIALFPNRLEARLTLALDAGPVLEVFDTFYWRNRGRYRADQAETFTLAALATRMMPADAAQAPALRPLAGSRPDDYAFAGTVVTVTPDAVHLLGRPLWRVGIRLAGADDRTGLVLPVHVSADGFADGWRPAPGDRVAGTLWLQARLAPAAPST